MAAFFRRIAKYCLIAAVAIGFLISPHFPHFMIQTWIALAADPGTRLEVRGLAGTVVSGFNVRGVEFSRPDGSGFTIDSMKVVFTAPNGIPEVSVKARTVNFRRETQAADEMSPPGNPEIETDVAARAKDAISKGTGFFSAWPGLVESVMIDALNLPDGVSARGVRIAEGKISADLFSGYGLAFDSLMMKLVGRGSGKAGTTAGTGMQEASGELFYGGKKVSISALLRPGRELRLSLSGEKRLFGGADMALVISLRSFTARVEASFDGTVLSGVIAPKLKGTAANGLKIHGRVSVSTNLDSGTIERLASGIYDLPDLGRAIVVFRDNSVDIPGLEDPTGRGKGLRATGVSGVVEAGRGYANLKGLTMRVAGASLRVIGRVSESSANVSFEADNFKPAILPLVKSRMAAADISSLSVNGRGTVKWASSGVNVEIAAKGNSGAIDFSGHKFRVESLSYSDDGARGSLDCSLRGSGGEIRVHGDRTRSGTDLAIASDAYELPEIGGVEIKGPMKFMASGVMEKGLAGLKVSAVLSDNGLTINDLDFTSVEGSITLQGGKLASAGFTGKYHGSFVEAKDYHHDLLTGNLGLSLESTVMNSSDAQNLAIRFSQASGWLKWVTVGKFARVCIDLSRKSGKWAAAGTVGFDSNPVSFSDSPGFTGYLFRALPGYELKINGVFGFGQSGLLSEGLRLSGNSKTGFFSALISFRSDPHASVPWARIGSDSGGHSHLQVSIDRCDMLALTAAAGARLPLDTLFATGFMASVPLGHDGDLILTCDEVRGGLKISGKDMEFSAANLLACLDMNPVSPRLVGLESDFHGGRLNMTDLSSSRIGSITLSDIDLSEIVKNNGIPLDISGKGCLSASLECYGPGKWRGPVSVFLKSGTVVEGFIPQRAIDKFFETPFINPLRLNWASVSMTLDTGAEWVLTTDDSQIGQDAPDTFARVQSIRIDSDKVKIGGDLKLSVKSEVSGNMVAQFPLSVAEYIKLGNFRTFFVRRGDELAPFSGKPQKVVYLPFRISGTAAEPSVAFDPEKQVLRQIVGNPLKLFNFIIPNTF